MLRIDLSLFYALLQLKGMPVCKKNVRVAAKKVGLFSGGYEFGYKTYCWKCYDACKFVIDEPVKLTNNQAIRNSHLINQESNSATLTDAEA